MPIRARTADWGLAGIADESGRVGSRVKAGHLPVPAGVRVEGDRLLWDGFSGGFWAQPDHVMLHSFLKLARLNDRRRAIGLFAKRYGPFGAAPIAADADPFPSEVEIDGQRWLIGYGSGHGSEPLAAWDAILESVVALMNVGVEVRQGRLGRREDWAMLDVSFDAGSRLALLRARAAIPIVANQWLRIGGVRLGLAAADPWRSADWQAEIQFGLFGFNQFGLFGAMALQTACVVAGIDLYCCTGCKLPYIRSRDERRPKPTENNYCNDCRESGQPLRDAKARYRKKGKPDAKKARSK